MRWWKRRSERDFAEEIEAHLALERDQQLAEGRTPEEARLAARKAFGNVTATQERWVESRRGAWLDSLWRNARFAVRALLRRPGYTFTAVVTLAFGIGVNSALFTVLYSFLLRPLPVRDAARVMSVSRTIHGNYGLRVFGNASMLSYPDFRRLQEGGHTMSDLSAYRHESLTLLAGDRATELQGQIASCNYFRTLRVVMYLGRPLAPDACATGADGGEVVLSYGAWQRHFGGDSSVVGRTIVLNRLPFTVVGIAERGFAGVEVNIAEAWLPITVFPRLHPGQPDDLAADISWLSVVGRLADGATRVGALAELSALARQEDAKWPGRETTLAVERATMLPAGDGRDQVGPSVAAVVALGLLVLAMACANVMNLQLSRAAARRRETGIRLSLGASRPRLVLHLLTESLILAFLGGAVGLTLAYWLPPLVLLTAPVPEVNLSLAPDGWVLLVTGVVAFGAALLFGLLPAWQSTDLSLTSAMRSAGPTLRVKGGSARVRSIAVGVQVAASALLLVMAALFLRATRLAFTVNPGYATEGVVALQFNLEQLGYDAAGAQRFTDEMQQALSTTPGIRSVAITQFGVLRGRGETVVHIDPSVQDSSADRGTLFNHVSGSYFATMGIPVVRGRPFTEQESAQHTPAPVVVNQAFARAAWGDLDPIGRDISEGDERMRVIGVVRTVQSVALGIDDRPYLYKPAAPDDRLNRLILVRSDLPALSVRSLAEAAALRIEPSVVLTARSIESEMDRAIAPVRIAGLFASGLGAVALLLAVVGVYGVVAFGVSQRSREIGIRIALGATTRSVHRLVLREGGRVIAIGLVVGLVAAALASQVIRSLLFGLDPLDVTAFGAVAILLGGAAAIAVSIPASRAARVDPVTSLREE